MQEKFQKLAFEEPFKGFDFSSFLFKNRKYQFKLALIVRLSSIAGKWREERCISSPLKSFPINTYFEDKRKFLWLLNIDFSRQLIQPPHLRLVLPNRNHQNPSLRL
jgi:hypothetical protein